MDNSEKYQKYSLCREMLETADVVADFKLKNLKTFADAVKQAEAVMLTGEGSSRIFPAKHSIYRELQQGMKTPIYTEGATQAQEYDLSRMAAFGASNSGRTGELIRLFTSLKKKGHSALFGLTVYENTLLEKVCKNTAVLRCGSEEAVAATKSVAEQALFYQAVFAAARGEELSGLEEAAKKIRETLMLEISPEIIEKIATAETIYFAGRNNGVAEELSLKTNEISRKKSDYLEGTYAAHGIEEVMKSEDVIIVIDPFEEEEKKFLECLQNGVGNTLISISTRKTGFAHSIVIPRGGDYQSYLELAAGWNLLVETGLKLGIDLDKPVRARKVGNEFTG
ncbi:MAG: hypothetical protein B6241_03005 [Spirochaetaceae bacterium 4572_59]|nr:MAG: hypothetical protein B6241_03005 [Spirochaetaceae bacterium 4572_59]